MYEVKIKRHHRKRFIDIVERLLAAHIATSVAIVAEKRVDKALNDAIGDLYPDIPREDIRGFDQRNLSIVGEGKAPE